MTPCPGTPARISLLLLCLVCGLSACVPPPPPLPRDASPAPAPADPPPPSEPLVTAPVQTVPYLWLADLTALRDLSGIALAQERAERARRAAAGDGDGIAGLRWLVSLSVGELEASQATVARDLARRLSASPDMAVALPARHLLNRLRGTAEAHQRLADCQRSAAQQQQAARAEVARLREQLDALKSIEADIHARDQAAPPTGGRAP